MPKSTRKTGKNKRGRARKQRPLPGPSRASPGAQAASPTAGSDALKHRLGLRGAAPWAARHAAKRAAEAEARNAGPPRPGSARATLRAPQGAEQLKAKVAELHNAMIRIRGLRKNLDRGFYDLGVELERIERGKLYEAKGYASFEAFVDRELDLGKIVAQKLSRVPCVFVKQAALEHGMSAVLAALGVLEESGARSDRAAAPAAPARRLPLKPPIAGRRN
jgi:hypothetical protein